MINTLSLYYLQLKILQHLIIVLDKAATYFFFLQDFNLKSNKLWVSFFLDKLKLNIHYRFDSRLSISSKQLIYVCALIVHF